MWLHFNIVKQRYMTHGDGAFQLVYTQGWSLTIFIISFEITMKSEGEILNNCKLAHKNRFRVKNSETNAQGKNPILYRKVENYSNIWKSDKDGGNNR